MNRKLLLLLATILSLAANGVLCAESEREYWLQQAESAALGAMEENQVEASKVLVEIQSAYLSNGDLEKGAKIALSIKDDSLRTKSHVSLAKHLSSIKADSAHILKVLEAAKGFAGQHNDRIELATAFIQYGDSPKVATELMLAATDRQFKLEHICCPLAQFGYLDEAYDLTEQENESEKSVLLFRIAKAAADAGRVADTERAVKALLPPDDTDLRAEELWLFLAEALHANEQHVEAQKYAARVKNKYLLRTNRRLLSRIEAGGESQKLAAVKPKVAPMPLFFGNAPAGLDKALESTAIEADKAVANAIAATQAKEIEATNGQFGPSNKDTAVASVRLRYAKVALLYHQAGDSENATKKIKEAEQALFNLSGANSFFALLSTGALVKCQMEIGDLESAKRTSDMLPAGLWSRHAGHYVQLALDSGDVMSAKEIALRATTADQGLGDSPSGVPTQVVSYFNTKGHTQTAFEVLKGCGLSNFGMNACREAGRVMIQAKQSNHMKTRRWAKELHPIQRSYMCLGAAETFGKPKQ